MGSPFDRRSCCRFSVAMHLVMLPLLFDHSVSSAQQPGNWTTQPGIDSAYGNRTSIGQIGGSIRSDSMLPTESGANRFDANPATTRPAAAYGGHSLVPNELAFQSSPFSYGIPSSSPPSVFESEQNFVPDSLSGPFLSQSAPPEPAPSPQPLMTPHDWRTQSDLQWTPAQVPEYYPRIGSEPVNLVVRDESLATVLSMIAEQHGLNVVTGDEVNGRITLTLNNVPLEEALNSILTVNGYTWNQHGNILIVSKVSTESQVSSAAQGRVLRVFPLNFVNATDIDSVVTTLLSPVGRSVVTESDSLNSRRTREELVVEDLPQYVARVAMYISQVDQPPRQVYVEAHVLEVELSDERRHGVNINQLLRLSRARVILDATGFADAASSPAFFLGIDGTDLDGLIEVLQTTTDAKTLASPKVMVLNGQEARIQIGSQLGYFVTTTTQTSTLQSVEFLDTGIVLSVTPYISDDGRILMHVKPEVSGGRINPDSGLPEEDTTEVETTIMLNDGQGMIIGGLINEEDIEIQRKPPILGDLWWIGRIFGRQTVTRSRREIIIALVPRILPCPQPPSYRESIEFDRASMPLLDGQLRRLDRTMWEPQLPDAMRDPRSIQWDRIFHAPADLHEPYPHPREYYYPSISEDAAGVYGPNGYFLPPAGPQHP